MLTLNSSVLPFCSTFCGLYRAVTISTIMSSLNNIQKTIFLLQCFSLRAKCIFKKHSFFTSFPLWFHSLKLGAIICPKTITGKGNRITMILLAWTNQEPHSRGWGMWQLLWHSLVGEQTSEQGSAFKEGWGRGINLLRHPTVSASGLIWHERHRN